MGTEINLLRDKQPKVQGRQSVICHPIQNIESMLLILLTRLPTMYLTPATLYTFQKISKKTWPNELLKKFIMSKHEKKKLKY